MIPFMTTSVPPPYARAQARRLTEILIALDNAVLNGQAADTWLARLFQENKSYGSKDRRLISNTAFSFFRWRGWLAGETPLDYGRAAAMAHALDQTEPHPVLTLLTPEHTSYEPIGALSLSQKATYVAQWLNLPETPSVQSLLPSWVPARLSHPDERTIEALQQRPPLWIRIRNGQACPPDFIPHAHVPNAAWSPAAVNRRDIERSYDIQDLASQCVGWVCAAQPGEDWWDVCAGAGGKTLQLADHMNGKGHLLATDIRTEALVELERRANTTGVAAMIRLRLLRSGVPGKKNLFDGVLVDAPCSGMGTWSRNPDARWRMTPEYMLKLAQKQKDILVRAAAHVKPGGRLVYAVCTLTSDETCEVRANFEKAHPDFVPDPFPHPLHQTPCDGAAWVLPGDGPCEGMFIARWKR